MKRKTEQEDQLKELIPMENQIHTKNKDKKWLSFVSLLILVFALIGIAITLMYKGIQAEKQDKIMETLYEQIQEASEISSDTSIPEDSIFKDGEIDSIDEQKEVVIPTSTPEVNPYASIFAKNKDMVAWIHIPDTQIDLPVVQTMWDENYYLTKDFYGRENSNGTLIMDTDSDTVKPSTNLIIHGHHMKSGAMFGDLDAYADEEYAKEHEIITMYFPTCQREYQVIAVFKSQVFKKSENVFKYYKFFEASNQEEFDNFYTNIKKLSLFDTGIEAIKGDNFLTLSTCAYHVANGRFVVVAKQISEKVFALEEEE